MSDRPSGLSSLVELLSELEPFDEARLTLEDGTTVEGRVNPVDFDPTRRLRLEIRPRLGEVRYELRATCREGQWTTPVVRRFEAGDQDWTDVGPVEAVETDRSGLSDAFGQPLVDEP